MRAKPLMRNPKPSQTMRGCHAHWRRNLVQRKASRVTHPAKSSSVYPIIPLCHLGLLSLQGWKTSWCDWVKANQTKSCFALKYCAPKRCSKMLRVFESPENVQPFRDCRVFENFSWDSAHTAYGIISTSFPRRFVENLSSKDQNAFQKPPASWEVLSPGGSESDDGWKSLIWFGAVLLLSGMD